MKLLLDTCALIWWTLDQAQLSPETLAVLNKSDEIFLSSISIWEVAIKIKNKKIDIGMDIQSYVEKLKEVSTLQMIPVTEDIWLKNIMLDWEHKDPADRTIVATAYLAQCAIVTTDQKIRSFYPKIFQS